MAVFRGYGVMEVEDIQLSDFPTTDVQTTGTPVDTPEETPKPGLRLFRLVVLSFGLLCMVQATLNVSLRLVLSNDDHNTDLSETCYSNLTRERDQLQTGYKDLTRERDQLQTINKRLTRQRDQLKTSNKDLTRERDQLQTINKNLARERDQLQTVTKNLTRERDLQRRLCERMDGWTRFGCSWYFVSTEVKTWEDSRQDCIRRGADLVVVNSREEQGFLLIFNKRLWIGLTDREVEGNFTWVDGTPLTTEYWIKGQPDNGRMNNDGKEEDCVEFFGLPFREPVKRWNDNGCGNGDYYVCERGLVLTEADGSVLRSLV